MFIRDYVMNGRGHGEVGGVLEAVRFERGLLRPFIEDDPNHPMRGRPCVIANSGLLDGEHRFKRLTVNNRDGSTSVVKKPILKQYLIRNLEDRGIRSPVFNATTLRKEEWIILDQAILRAARLRLRAWADLAARNTYGGFNGMAKMILEHETMNDPGEAQVDMDASTEGRDDQSLFQLQGLPLVITHSDFALTQRYQLVSENSGTPASTTRAESAGRRVAEMIEAMTIGTRTGPTYGGNSTQVGGYGRASSVYGYTNFPPRLTKINLTAPTAGGWVAGTTLAEILAMRDQLYAGRMYGPFMLYHTNDWDKYLDNDYILTGGNVATQTLRNRIRAIGGSTDGQDKGIEDVRRLDFWFGSTPDSTKGAGTGFDATLKAFSFLMVQMTAEVARAVNGMDLTTIQWEEKGGFKLKFKVMAIQVPQLRADYYGNCGILHGTTS